MTRVKKKVGDKIDIEWVDSVESQGWHRPKDLIQEDKYELCFTRGWYVGATKNTMIVTCTKGFRQYDGVLGYIQIPKCSITKIR